MASATPARQKPRAAAWAVRSMHHATAFGPVVAGEAQGAGESQRHALPQDPHRACPGDQGIGRECPEHGGLGRRKSEAVQGRKPRADAEHHRDGDESGTAKTPGEQDADHGTQAGGQHPGPSQMPFRKPRQEVSDAGQPQDHHRLRDRGTEEPLVSQPVAPSRYLDPPQEGHRHGIDGLHPVWVPPHHGRALQREERDPRERRERHE